MFDGPGPKFRIAFPKTAAGLIIRSQARIPIRHEIESNDQSGFAVLLHALSVCGHRHAGGFAAQFLHRVVALGFAVAINRFLLLRAGLSGAHAEQRRLQHIDVAVVDELLEEAEEIRDHQIADVHAVHPATAGRRWRG